mmetsp:Transcript_24890/g.71481  ORF Transcript_24890/g.71481 Transcript_24890/m.71481 type:complete len:280 (-) Transcript_24890:393-1232(-)
MGPMLRAARARRNSKSGTERSQATTTRATPPGAEACSSAGRESQSSARAPLAAAETPHATTCDAHVSNVKAISLASCSVGRPGGTNASPEKQRPTIAKKRAYSVRTQLSSTTSIGERRAGSTPASARPAATSSAAPASTSTPSSRRQGEAAGASSTARRGAVVRLELLSARRGRRAALRGAVSVSGYRRIGPAASPPEAGSPPERLGSVKLGGRSERASPSPSPHQPSTTTREPLSKWTRGPRGGPAASRGCSWMSPSRAGRPQNSLAASTAAASDTTM